MKVTFGDADKDDLELVRNVVLERLKDDVSERRNSLQVDPTGDGYRHYVTFRTYDNQARFLELSVEIIWELIVQGVMTTESRFSKQVVSFHTTHNNILRRQVTPLRFA